ncbi:hypothetical protein [Pseudonocardia sp. WMMC193]|uniref:hypothetical protein n=1 Tax=Pseudonocardia sp. WMMC193 TaxID=2911965 RepID=UPI001F3BE019|nr:hypothetical protein [Pseudonocardia sp. WMMC193]MCF7550825.1 hypothetical protein [Pseudonocardia sp. WMMC193]
MELDVTTLRGRHAVHRWERTSVGDVLERLTWSRPDEEALVGRPGALRPAPFLPVVYHVGDQLLGFGAFLAGGTVPIGRRSTPEQTARSVDPAVRA